MPNKPRDITITIRVDSSHRKRGILADLTNRLVEGFPMVLTLNNLAIAGRNYRVLDVSTEPVKEHLRG